MIFLRPASLYLSLLAGVILLLYLLRTRTGRREVATLFLWKGLPSGRTAPARRLRLLVDPLLILQLLALLFIVLSLAEPTLQTGSASRIAILIDGSASMRTIADGEHSRYELAVKRAIALLDEGRAGRAAVISLSDHPRILVGPEGPRDEAAEALASSRPGWYADASPSDLSRMIAAIGGEGEFDRAVLFSDRPFPDPPPFLETIAITGGENGGITAFTIREDPAAGGVDAFVRVDNYGGEDRAGRLRISDGADSVEMAILIPSGSSEDYVIPFPTSRSVSFTAALEPADDFPADDIRYFALARPIELSVRWVGTPDRYLLAALRAAVPVRLVGEGADLTIIYDADPPPDVTGDVLLVHAGMPGIVRLGGDGGGGDVLALAPDHPLLAGVRPADLRVWSVPFLDSIAPGDVLLTAAGRPFLVEFAEGGRRVWFLASELAATNLPVTVDLPILVQNIVRRVIRLPAPLDYRWAVVGAGIPLRGSGEPVDSVVGPDGGPIQILPGQAAFFPPVPGEYRLVTKRGTYPVGVNVPLSESLPPPVIEPGEDRVARLGGPAGLRPLWPILAGLAAFLLVVEWFAYARVDPFQRRPR